MVKWCQKLVQRWANLIKLLNIFPCWNMKLDNDGAKGFSDNGSNLLDQCIPLYFMLLLLIFNVFIYFLTHKAYSLSADGKRPDIGINTETEKVSDSLLRNYTRHLFCFGGFFRFRLVLSGCLILFDVQCAPIGCLTLQYTHCHVLGFNWIDSQDSEGTQTD